MLRRLLLALGLAACAPALAGAQERVCDYSSVGRTEQVEQGGASLILLHDPFEVRCTDGTLLRANSGTLDRQAREFTLTGNVFFQDLDRELTADNATYSTAIGRLYATGNVVFTNRAEGSTIRGPELEYFRPLPERPEPQIIARQRPHLVLRPRAGDEDSEPLELDADLVTIRGEDQLDAVGSVVVTRSDLRATSGEARYVESEGVLDLRRDARIQSEQFSLAGQTIHARLREGAIEYVRSREQAQLSGDDLTVTAPEVQLFFADSVLQRAVARAPEGEPGSPRAVAVSPSFRMEADSLDATLPGQRLEQVVAIGRARGEAIDTLAAAPGAAPDGAAAVPPDSAAPAVLAIVQNDWIVGDTVIGFFAPRDSAGTAASAPADSAAAVVLERLVARGDAQSLYRVAREDVPEGSRRGVNFLSGDTIELSFQGGELALAQVTGLRKGLYLEPTPPAGTPERSGSPPAPEPPGSSRSAPREE